MQGRRGRETRRGNGRERKMKEGFLFSSQTPFKALTPILMFLLGVRKLLNSWSALGH